MEKGMRFELEKVVSEEMTAVAMGSGTLRVLATPAMIALIEEAAWRCVSNELDEGSSTVGTLLNVEHLAPTPVGMKVKAEATLTEVDGRRLAFDVYVTDEKGLIGRGKHERFIVFSEKFQKKADAKLEA